MQCDRALFSCLQMQILSDCSLSSCSNIDEKDRGRMGFTAEGKVMKKNVG